MVIDDPQGKARACIIWMHGLGADSQDMHGLSKQLRIEIPVRHVFLDAPIRPVTVNNNMPMRAWYDITGTELTDREDKEGIHHAEDMILDEIKNQCDDGFDSHNIFLAGFSQGGAMALYTGLRHKLPLAGIIALSSYLPLAREVSFVLPCETPIFAAIGINDPIVLPSWSTMSFDAISRAGYGNIVRHEYPMEHSVCYQELLDLSAWISEKIVGGKI